MTDQPRYVDNELKTLGKLLSKLDENLDPFGGLELDLTAVSIPVSNDDLPLGTVRYDYEYASWVFIPAEAEEEPILEGRPLTDDPKDGDRARIKILDSDWLGYPRPSAVQTGQTTEARYESSRWISQADDRDDSPAPGWLYKDDQVEVLEWL